MLRRLWRRTAVDVRLATRHRRARRTPSGYVAQRGSSLGYLVEQLGARRKVSYRVRTYRARQRLHHPGYADPGAIRRRHFRLPPIRMLVRMLATRQRHTVNRRKGALERYASLVRSREEPSARAR